MSREQWSGFQQEIGEWRDKTLPSSLNNPQREFERGLEEVQELHEAIQMDDGSPAARREIAEEGVDVIIGMLSVVDVTGHNAADLIAKKLGVMREKYPPDRIAGDLAEGVPFDITMARHKAQWQQRQGGQPSVSGTELRRTSGQPSPPQRPTGI